MASESDNEPRFGLSQEEAQAAFSGPAPMANRFYVHIAPNGVRITFCEQGSVDSGYYFRSAALVSIADARSLRDLLTELLEGEE